MLRLLLAWPVLSCVLAALDTFLTRLGQAHRATDPALFGETLLLWLGFGALGLAPAWVSSSLLRERRGAAAGHLLFWTLLPVVAHGVLDRHTSIGADVSALFAPEPWLQALVAAAILAALAAGIGRAVGSMRPRRVAAAGLAASLVVGLLLPWRSAPGPGAPAAGSADAEPARPNVLFLVWDTTRAQSVSAYGYERPTTPALERLAQEALLFEEARSVTVFTFSSHLSMLTGLFPSQHGGTLAHMAYDPAEAPGVARLLRRAGYRTGAFVGTSVLAAHTGLDDGFEVYDDLVDPPVCDTHAWGLVHDVQALLAGSFRAFHQNGRPHGIQDFQRPADEVLASAAAWIARDDPRPWFCMINLYDAHWPYLPEGEGRALVGEYSGPMNGFGRRADGMQGRDYEPTPADERHLTELYEGEILDLDAAVAAFLEGLDLQSGRTAVLVTSDHGEAFGEAGVWEHDDIYEPQVRVPLLVRPAGPDPEGAVLAGPASGIDVAPTLLGLAGVPAPEGLPGLDLTREEPPAEREVLVQDRDALVPEKHRAALYRGHWKVERRGTPEEGDWFLYDLSVDPVGEFDLGEVYPERLAALRAALEAREAELGVGFLGSGPGDAALDALEALGYLER